MTALKIDYRNLKPCTCRLDGQDHFCFKRTPSSPCMRKRKKGFDEVLDAMGERFNIIKDNMITKLTDSKRNRHDR